MEQMENLLFLGVPTLKHITAPDKAGFEGNFKIIFSYFSMKTY